MKMVLVITFVNSPATNVNFIIDLVLSLCYWYFDALMKKKYIIIATIIYWSVESTNGIIFVMSSTFSTETFLLNKLYGEKQNHMNSKISKTIMSISTFIFNPLNLFLFLFLIIMNSIRIEFITEKIVKNTVE